MIEYNNKNIKRWMMLGARNAFGTFLTDTAAENNKIFALSADFTKSSGLNKFKEIFPDRFLSTGIAEQQMIATASGLASEGYNVFATSFASFITTRCYEQVKINLGYMKSNVKLVGIASGLGVSYQGNTHYGLDDVSLMRIIPNMTIIVPSDCTEVAKSVEALSDYEGPVYLRIIGEGFVPIVNEEDYHFEIGKGVKKREGDDILILANGPMVSQSLKASSELSKEGIEACVINMHTVKPLDENIIKENMEGKKLIISVEEGQLNGGLGSAIADYISGIAKSPKLLRIGVKDLFPHAGSYQYLLDQCGLTVEKIIKNIKENL